MLTMNRLVGHTLILIMLYSTGNYVLADGHIQKFSDCSDCPDMVIVKPGTFVMGFDGGVNSERYEGPVRTVSIKQSYALGVTEVTNLQYTNFINSTGYVSGDTCAVWDGKTWNHMEGKDWRDPGYGRSPMDNEPVACITWLDAKAYVSWLSKHTGYNYRLPTEAEWEYASRARRAGIYAWGDDPNVGCTEGNIYDASGSSDPRNYKHEGNQVDCDDGYNIVAPVASLKANEFGLYDMIGNVWEWVEDCYIVPIPLSPVDGSAVQVPGSCEQRAVKGGAWSSSLTWQRPTFRGRDPVDRISHIFGFRVARDIIEN